MSFGYILKKSFKDINECTTGTHNCDSNASCTNIYGSFTCACNSGFRGNGISCTGKRNLFPFVTCFIFQMLHHSKFHLTYNLLLQHFILSIQTSTNVQMEQITVTTMLIAVTHKETIFAPASSASPVLESPVQVKKSRIFII